MIPSPHSSSEWGEGTEALLKADPAAFEIMVKEFAAPLRRFVFRYTRSREAASELVQDVFFKLWSKRAQLAEIDFISPGSLVVRQTSCGKPGCRCQADRVARG